MKLKTVMKSIPALQEISALPIKANVSFIIKKVLKAAQVNAELYEEQYKAVLTKYGTPQENGTYLVGPENHQKVTTELVELDATEVDMPAYTIKLSSFAKNTDKSEWYDVKSSVFVDLDWFIEEDL